MADELASNPMFYQFVQFAFSAMVAALGFFLVRTLTRIESKVDNINGKVASHQTEIALLRQRVSINEAKNHINFKCED